MTETRLWGRGREGGGGAGGGKRGEGPESGGKRRPGRRGPCRAALRRPGSRAEASGAAPAAQRAEDPRDPHPPAPRGLPSPRTDTSPLGNLTSRLRNRSLPVWEEKSSRNPRAVDFTHTQKRFCFCFLIRGVEVDEP